MRKTLIILAIIFLSFPRLTLAVCPVCTVAVGAGLGLAEYFGIDDSISGLWIGALAVSLIIWTINWLDKKNIRFKGRKVSVALGYYLVIVGPLWAKGFIGHPLNKYCGMDKLLLGIILGTILFTAGVLSHDYLRKRNNHISYFKGQKIAIPLALLLVASLILYYSCQVL